MKLLIITMLLAAAFACVAMAQSPQAAKKDAGDAAPQVGKPAPDFSLKGSDGKTYSLRQFKGKKAVVVAWFPKAFTGG